MDGKKIKEVLEKKRRENWKGWKVPIPLLLDVIKDHVSVAKDNIMDVDYIVFAAKDGNGNLISVEKSKLYILGHTMDKGQRDLYLKKYYDNPNPDPRIDPDNPGEIDQFPPW
jgi:hypothetical protein